MTLGCTDETSSRTACVEVKSHTDLPTAMTSSVFESSGSSSLPSCPCAPVRRILIFWLKLQEPQHTRLSAPGQHSGGRGIPKRSENETAYTELHRFAIHP